MNDEKLLQYSKELSLLSQLLQCKLITETEYQKIKMKLMYIPTRQSTLHGVLVHGFRRYSARFPVISA